MLRFSASYTTSLKSSVLNYKYENGRRYNAHGQGEDDLHWKNEHETDVDYYLAYFLPNDEVGINSKLSSKYVLR